VPCKFLTYTKTCITCVNDIFFETRYLNIEKILLLVLVVVLVLKKEDPDQIRQKSNRIRIWWTRDIPDPEHWLFFVAGVASMETF
jgi:hypothetical protein